MIPARAGIPILTRHDVPIAQLTTFQTVGAVKTVIDFQSPEEVSDYVRSVSPDDFYILGRGSNSLINPDSAVPVVIRMAADAVIPERDGTRIRLGAGLPMNRLQDFAVKQGLSGLEFAAGVPASLGGMVAMNFGCWGRSMSDFVTGIQVVDDLGSVRWLTPSEAHFSYRSSIFHRKKWVVVAAELQMTSADSDAVRAAMLANIQTRIEKQPLRDKTFGSIFKNPPGHYAAQLLEAAGLKGQRWGAIQLSDRHANFLLNMGGATYADTIQVLQILKSTVQSTATIELELEVQLFK